MTVEGRCEGEIENEIMAAQDQALQIGYHATKILQTDSKVDCKQCDKTVEGTDHIGMQNIGKRTIQ